MLNQEIVADCDESAGNLDARVDCEQPGRDMVRVGYISSPTSSF